MARFGAAVVITGGLALGAEPGPTPPAGRESLRIEALSAQQDSSGRTLRVGFRVAGAFDERICEEISSGLPVRFQHRIEVRRRRPLWWDATVLEKAVVTSAVLDAMSREYTLSRKVDGGTVETVATGDEAAMRRFMTELDGVRIDLPPELVVDGRIEVRVRSTLETRFFLFFPYALETDWARLELPAAAIGEPADGR